MATRRTHRSARRTRSAPRTAAAAQAGPGLLASELSAMVSELDDIRAACVLVQISLRTQNADHDAEMAACLRSSVAAPLERKIAQLQRLIETAVPARGVAA